MQFFAVAALLFTAAFAAPSTEAPAGLARRTEAWCPPGLLYSNPLCCDTDVLGVADVDCVTPPEAPSKCKSFGSVCASIGRQPKCCAIPVAGLALLCTDAIPQY
ncbi:HFB3 protein [Trichoderma guizhouense]|uniref:HFB3 protein n=1 Tax=Trichoderma guizhouense TaxID=1491466 RepID=A0A1T3CWR1_9HYPO|nr:hydrophobin [Trichoderma guizhouense]OPB45549.1 HFB3 protein [Trichoderma guizhouense]